MRLNRFALSGAIACAALTTGACSWFTSTDEGTFRGIYQHAFEVSSFRPCRSSQLWWLEDASGTLFGQLPPPDPVSMVRVAYVVVDGKRSARGEYGHLGIYDYALTVTSVAAVASDTTGACN